MKDSPDRLQWAMNTCLAQIGVVRARLRARALKIGERLEVLKDYPTIPGCTSPFVPTWVNERWSVAQDGKRHSCHRKWTVDSLATSRSVVWKAISAVAALAIAAAVVDVSPFSTDGALIVATAREDDRQRVYRQQMAYAGAVVLTGPLLARALLVPMGIV